MINEAETKCCASVFYTYTDIITSTLYDVSTLR